MSDTATDDNITDDMYKENKPTPHLFPCSEYSTYFIINMGVLSENWDQSSKYNFLTKKVTHGTRSINPFIIA